MNFKWKASLFLILITTVLPGGFLIANDTPNDRVQYILLNFTNPSESAFAEVAATFEGYRSEGVKIGVGVIVSYLAAPPAEVVKRLKNFLSYSEKYNLPIIIQIDGEQWWDYRSDLWNWWDASKPGYNPDNKQNVEWAGWSPNEAIKIGWRNWGKQLRVLPMPNLMSTAYREACHTEMARLVPIISAWYRNLSPDQKHLFVGLKVGWESAIGVNNWYYPDGNDLIDGPESKDPQYGLTIDSLPSRGVTPIGYAAVSTLGLARSGDLKQEDVTEVIRFHLEDMSKRCAEMGIPRNRLFTHGGGWSKGETLYMAAVNRYSCPGWSFYDFAGDPVLDTTAMNALVLSDAPFWGAVEWLYSGKNAEDWYDAIQNTLNVPKVRYLCVFNWEGVKMNAGSVEAIKKHLSN